MSKYLLLFLLPLVTSSLEERLCNSPKLYDDHPVLCKMLDRLYQDEESFANEISTWAKKEGLLVGSEWPKVPKSLYQGVIEDSKQLPVVFAHGMGDSCFNSGFQRIVQHTSQLLNDVYTVCVPTGKTQSEDTTNGYFLNMDASVDVFAQAIQEDPKLAEGFHAVGLSQGNNVIRGYIARYNDPPVDTFISINGVNAGTGALPNCFPKTEESLEGVGGMCELLIEQASRRAYTEFAQKHSFQANYWRDPKPSQKEAYQKYSQLARWNNEGEPFNQTLKDNYAKTNHFVWIMATNDEMVWPKEGEQWGAADPNAPFQKILPRNETEWYIKDLFGLRTAEEQVSFFGGFNVLFRVCVISGWSDLFMRSFGCVGQEYVSFLRGKPPSIFNG